MCNYPYDRCYYCGKMVKLNKFILGSFHICITEEQRRQVDIRRAQSRIPIKPQETLGSLLIGEYIQQYKGQDTND